MTAGKDRHLSQTHLSFRRKRAMNNLILSYSLDYEPTYPTEEQAHEAYLLAGWDYLADEEVWCDYC